jgi:hypothetical protein
MFQFDHTAGAVSVLRRKSPVRIASGVELLLHDVAARRAA